MSVIGSFADRASHATREEFPYRAAVTLAALAMASIIMRIPAPGLDLAGWPQGNATQDISRLSIGALGFNTVVTALVIAEVLRLAHPGIDVWLTRSRDHERKYNRGVLGLALVLCALQAWGVASALESFSPWAGQSLVAEPGMSFRMAYIVTQMAALALFVVLADIITRHGIGSGYFVMFVWGEVAAIPSILTSLMTGWSFGHVTGRDAIFLVLLSLAALAATAAMLSARYVTSNGTQTSLGPRDIVIPALLSASLGWVLMMAIGAIGWLFGQDFNATSLFNLTGPVRLAAVVLLAVLIALLRAARVPSDRRPHAVFLAAAGSIGALAAAGFEILSVRTGVWLIPGHLLVIIFVICLAALPPITAEEVPVPDPTKGGTA